MMTLITLHPYHSLLEPAYMYMGDFWSHFLSRNKTLWCVLTLPVALMRDITTIGQPWACNLEVPVQIPVEPDICHHDCADTVLQIVQRNGVYNAPYGTVHKEQKTLKVI